MLLIPVHQFEIRYTYLTDFAVTAREIIAPFALLATNIKIENENLTSSRYILLFEKDNYSIIFSWDRLIIRYEGDLDSLIINNSIIEQPFLNMVSKIKEAKYFGKITNYLCYTIFVKIYPKEFQSPSIQESNIKSFSKRFLNLSETDLLISNPSDFAINLEKKRDGKQQSIIFGPYRGVEDLHKRGIIAQTKKIIDNSELNGEIAEVKILEELNNISFGKYKEAVKNSFSIIDILWKS